MSRGGASWREGSAGIERTTLRIQAISRPIPPSNRMSGASLRGIPSPTSG